MGVWGALAGAIVLLLVLLAWVRADAPSKDSRSAWGASFQEPGESVEICPPEIVSQIFSADDLKFVGGFESPSLERLFRRERTAVALHWVQETSAIISRIMRRHSGAVCVLLQSGWRSWLRSAVYGFLRIPGISGVGERHRT